eukprot:TRINITY_DN9803_c0_g1_i1.p1 TRINITY_DN9803_c0_g1~~TRINITY_DN9803_c0_g1_i1.p1  ORF type:complete len:656 (-),score=177.75 TRINITY_DN9803_c0_g1_i1:149-2116(-)
MGCFCSVEEDEFSDIPYELPEFTIDMTPPMFNANNDSKPKYDQYTTIFDCEDNINMLEDSFRLSFAMGSGKTFDLKLIFSLPTENYFLDVDKYTNNKKSIFYEINRTFLNEKSFETLIKESNYNVWPFFASWLCYSANSQKITNQLSQIFSHLKEHLLTCDDKKCSCIFPSQFMKFWMILLIRRMKLKREYFEKRLHNTLSNFYHLPHVSVKKLNFKKTANNSDGDVNYINISSIFYSTFEIKQDYWYFPAQLRNITISTRTLDDVIENFATENIFEMSRLLFIEDIHIHDLISSNCVSFFESNYSKFSQSFNFLEKKIESANEGFKKFEMNFHLQKDKLLIFLIPFFDYIKILAKHCDTHSNSLFLYIKNVLACIGIPNKDDVVRLTLLNQIEIFLMEFQIEKQMVLLSFYCFLIKEYLECIGIEEIKQTKFENQQLRKLKIIWCLLSFSDILPIVQIEKLFFQIASSFSIHSKSSNKVRKLILKYHPNDILKQARRLYKLCLKQYEIVDSDITNAHLTPIFSEYVNFADKHPNVSYISFESSRMELTVNKYFVSWCKLFSKQTNRNIHASILLPVVSQTLDMISEQQIDETVSTTFKEDTVVVVVDDGEKEKNQLLVEKCFDSQIETQLDDNLVLLDDISIEIIDNDPSPTDS